MASLWTGPTEDRRTMVGSCLRPTESTRGWTGRSRFWSCAARGSIDRWMMIYWYVLPCVFFGVFNILGVIWIVVVVVIVVEDDENKLKRRRKGKPKGWCWCVRARFSSAIDFHLYALSTSSSLFPPARCCLAFLLCSSFLNAIYLGFSLSLFFFLWMLASTTSC